jgi:hypothetical protein
MLCKQMLRAFIFICAFSSLIAADVGDTVNIRIAGAKNKILIGDPVRVEINIRHRTGESYQLKIDPAGLGFFEQRGAPAVESRAIDGQSAQTQIAIILVPYATGKLPIPPLLLEEASGGGRLQTPPLLINVEPLSAPQDQQIKEVRPLPKMPLNGWLQPVILTILFASAGLYLLLRFADARVTSFIMAWAGLLAARRVSEPVSPAVTYKTLEDETIARLRLLLASGLASIDVKRFHIQLSDIMTGYAVVRYGEQGREYTRGELFSLFESSGVPILVTSAFEQILEACEFVKFAQGRPGTELAERAARQAIDLLNALNFNNTTKKSL